MILKIFSLLHYPWLPKLCSYYPPCLTVTTSSVSNASVCVLDAYRLTDLLFLVRIGATPHNRNCFTNVMWENRRCRFGLNIKIKPWVTSNFVYILRSMQHICKKASWINVHRLPLFHSCVLLPPTVQTGKQSRDIIMGFMFVISDRQSFHWTVLRMDHISLWLFAI